MEAVWCMMCNRLCETDHCVHVFKTGFKQMEGVDYPLGVCEQCNRQKLTLYSEH